jgi:hypothetical protein
MGDGVKKGWRRVGIVLSVIWFVAFGSYLWSSGVSSMGQFHRQQLEGCYQILTADNEALQYIQKPEERDKRQATYWAKFQKCQVEAGNFFTRQFNEQKAAIPLLLAIDLGTILIAWLLIWFVVVVLRWVGKGFASA